MFKDQNTLALIIAFTIPAYLSFANVASATDPLANASFEERTETQGDWTFSVTPYLWAAGLSGRVGVFGKQPVDLDLSFSDILDGLKFSGMVTGDATNGTWGVFGDLIYLNAAADQTITRDVVGIPKTLNAAVDVESLTATLMGEYRVPLEGPMTIDVMAGARIWSVDNDIRVSLTRGGPKLSEFSGSDGSTWVDPMVGLKVRLDTDAHVYLAGWGMVGGFGVGSDFAWDVLAGIGYDWNNTLSSTLGYRALGVDYSHDGFVFNIQQRGLFLGTTLRF
jgi:hypothetical protein